MFLWFFLLLQFLLNLCCSLDIDSNPAGLSQMNYDQDCLQYSTSEYIPYLSILMISLSKSAKSYPSTLFTSLVYINLIVLTLSAPPLSNCNPMPCEYNMIDTDPECYSLGICQFAPGGQYSAFPNSEEKMQAQMHNMFRMHANESLTLTLGRYLGGVVGGATFFYSSKDGCGGTMKIDDRAPLYWYSLANQMARFKQFDEDQCDQCWYKFDTIPSPCPTSCIEDSANHGCGGGGAHATCAWNLDGGSNCAIFLGDTGDNSRCDYASRSATFGFDDDSDFFTEGICGNNYCYTDGHCTPVFNLAHDYQGTGFKGGTNGVDTVYSSNGIKEEDYLLVGGSHYDDRIKVHTSEWNADGKYFGLLLEYFDRSETIHPKECFAIYGGAATAMPVYVMLPHGSETSDTFIPTHSAFFQQNFLPPSQCEPYSFLCLLDDNSYVRLPENRDYYFGTEWIDWSWTTYVTQGDAYLCQENHYYKHSTEGWTVNGGPTLTQSDIWYYLDTTSYGTCIGCNHIDILICIESCIIDSTATDCNSHCTGVSPAPTGVTPSPIDPTPSPTDPTASPTNPTTSPTDPTASPTDPTSSPTGVTPSPIDAVSPTNDTPSPTNATPSPSDDTSSPTNPTASPTDPTASPTDPTPSPTDPTASPTNPTPSPTGATPSPTRNTPSPIQPPTNATPSPTDTTSSPTDATSSPTNATPSPIPPPTEATPSPSEATPSPTGATPAPQTAATPSLQTCLSTLNVRYIMGEVTSFDATSDTDEYLEKFEKEFITNNPDCAIDTASSGRILNEYYYYLNYVSKKNQLKCNLQMCCGGHYYTFGSNTPPSSYHANQLCIDRYGEAALNHEENEWIGPNIGIKQIVVYCIMGAILICCCFGCWRLYVKHKKKNAKEAPELNSELSPRARSNGDDIIPNIKSNPNLFTNVSASIQMHGKATLTKMASLGSIKSTKSDHYKIENESTDASSTDTDNNDNDNNNNHLRLNINPRSNHQVVPTQSFDLDIDEIANYNNTDSDNDNNNNNNIGLPPPFTEPNINHDGDDEWHE